jgi:signal transduction histidine kinase
VLERGAPPEMRAGLAEAAAIGEETVVELRRIIAALSPAVLERLGLKQALHQLVARFQKVHAAHVRLQIGANSDTIPRQIQEVVYRVAQESLQNVAKHSHATRVNLFLRTADKRIKLGVHDNGAGFADGNGRNGGNGGTGGHRGNKDQAFGLAGMRERATLLGGTLAVRSAPGKGVAVTLDLPGKLPAAGQNGMAGNGKDSCTVD